MHQLQRQINEERHEINLNSYKKICQVLQFGHEFFYIIPSITRNGFGILLSSTKLTDTRMKNPKAKRDRIEPSNSFTSISITYNFFFLSFCLLVWHKNIVTIRRGKKFKYKNLLKKLNLD